MAELVRPYPDTLELITAWLVHHGIRSSSISTTHGGAWLTVTDVLVSQANQLLDASYQLYRNVETKHTIIRTVGYALPSALHTHIRAVTPTTHFTSTRVARQTPRRRSFATDPAQEQATSGKLVTALSSRDRVIKPEFLHWLYGTEEYVFIAPEQNKIAVVGFDAQFPSFDDYISFMDIFFGPDDEEDEAFTIVHVNDDQFDQNNPTSGHANLVVQYAAAMAQPTPLIFYSTGGHVMWGAGGEPIPGDMYLEWFNHILEEPNIPQTIIFWGGDNELDLPAAYAYSLCNLFAQLSSRGVSVLADSGSEGVGVGDCINGEGNVRFVPVFPSTCTCCVLSPLPGTRPAQVQVTNKTTLVSQVPGSLASAALQTIPRSRRASPEAAFQSTFRTRGTSGTRWGNSFGISTLIPAISSELATMT